VKYRYGLECLFRFFSYGLEKKYRKDLVQDFMEFTIRDHKDGYLYGLEKFWAFLKYRKDKRPIEIPPELQKLLSQFRTMDDFKRAKASRHQQQKRNSGSAAEIEPIVRRLSFNEFPPLSTSPSTLSKSPSVLSKSPSVLSKSPSTTLSKSPSTTLNKVQNANATGVWGSPPASAIVK